MNREELYAELSKQKEEMSAEERMCAYSQGKEVDYQPYGLLTPDGAFANIWGYSKGDMLRSFELRVNIMQRKIDEYGISGIYIPLGLRGIGEAMGSTLCYPENSEDYVAKHVLQDYTNLNALEELDMSKNPQLLARLEEGRKMQEHFPDMIISTNCAGPLSAAIATRPIELVLRDMRKNPDSLHRLLKTCVTHSLKWVEMFHKSTGGTSVGVGDPVTTTDIMGKKLFCEFSKPYLKQLLDGIVKITGKSPLVHICGHTKNIWKDLLEIGVKYFSIDNCENLNEAKQILGGKIFLFGNVAPVDVMARGNIDDVIKAVQKCLKEGSDSQSGYMLNTGCQLPIGTPKENIDAYIFAVRKYGAFAKLGALPKGLEFL